MDSEAKAHAYMAVTKRARDIRNQRDAIAARGCSPLVAFEIIRQSLQSTPAPAVSLTALETLREWHRVFEVRADHLTRAQPAGFESDEDALNYLLVHALCSTELEDNGELRVARAGARLLPVVTGRELSA